MVDAALPRLSEPTLAESEDSFRAACELYDEGSYGEAAAACRRILAARPDAAGAHTLLGLALAALGEVSQALGEFDAALRGDPESVLLRVNRACMLLALGDYRSGFAEFEWRWKRDDLRPLRELFPQRWWNGEDISGRTIVLFAEQGFGDAIQFARFAPVVAERTGARVVVDCHPPLQRLFAGLRSVERVLESDAEIPGYELCCPLMSVPHVLGTTLETIPGETPYLSAPAGHAAKWSQKLGQPGKALRVGMVWTSKPQAEYAWAKSVPLELLAPLARIPGVSLVSLQTEDAAEQAADVPGMKIADFSTELTDFCETAGLIANLDLVISIDTAVAHLAGAMGKRVWTLVPHVPDWRWYPLEERSAWYPTMRIFRQAAPDDWESVLAPLASALRSLAGAKP